MVKIIDSTGFWARLQAAEEAAGLEGSGITEQTEMTDSLDTTRYDVVMIPRKPQPKGEAPKV